MLKGLANARDYNSFGIHPLERSDPEIDKGSLKGILSDPSFILTGISAFSVDGLPPAGSELLFDSYLLDIFGSAIPRTAIPKAYLASLRQKDEQIINDLTRNRGTTMSMSGMILLLREQALLIAYDGEPFDSKAFERLPRVFSDRLSSDSFERTSKLELNTRLWMVTGNPTLLADVQKDLLDEELIKNLKSSGAFLSKLVYLYALRIALPNRFTELNVLLSETDAYSVLAPAILGPAPEDGFDCNISARFFGYARVAFADELKFKDGGIVEPIYDKTATFSRDLDTPIVSLV